MTGLAHRLTAALWIAVVAGLTEGVLATVLNAMPLLRAANKASASQIWITPLSNAVYFMLLATAAHGALRLARRWAEPHEARLWWIPMLALASFTILDAPGVLHRWGAALLALGIGVAAARAIVPRESAIGAAFRRGVLLLPLIVLVAAGAVWGSRVVRERSAVAGLPAVQRP